MFLPAFILIASISAVLIVVFNKTNKERTAWTQFYTRGKDAGFTLRENEILRNLVVEANVAEPSSIFYSQEQLEYCIKFLVRKLNMVDGENSNESNMLLSKLYDFRQKIEMEKPTGRAGIFNSRQISEGQNLRVLVEGSGVFRSQVVRNDNDYLTISLPISNKPSGTFSWMGQKISLYFWREEDAGYVFDSEVVDELFAKGLASLRIVHTDSLFRTQKRKSIRIKMNKPAYLYLLDNNENAHTLEKDPGLNCYLEDISDSGCAIMVGGLGEADMRIKVQFALSNSPTVMSGTVRGVVYKEDLNRSLLRVEADPLPVDVRNKILGEVFGTSMEDDDDSPFRMLEEGAVALQADRGLDAVARGNVNDIGVSFG